MKRPFTIASLYLLVSVVFLFAGCRSSANVANPDSTTNVADTTNVAKTELKGGYESFTENTTLAEIIQVYGKPDVEEAFPVTLPTTLDCYINQNLCFVLVNKKHVQEPNNNAYYNYVGTITIDPSAVAHYVPSSEGGDTRPLMEFLRGQVAQWWAKNKNKFRQKPTGDK